MSESLYSVLRRGVEPARLFLVTPEGRRWLYGDLDAATAHYARRLRAFGLLKGDRVVAQLDKSVWALFLYLACLRTGIVFIPLNPELRPNELGPILADADPRLFVCRSNAAPQARAVAPRQIWMRTLNSDGTGSFADAPDNGFETEVDAPVTGDDIAAIIFTSGTTGRPKGAMMPHGHLLAKALALTEALEWQRSDVLLHAMPIHHSHGLFMTTHCVLAAGASMLFLPRFDAAEVVDILPKVTVFSGIPTMYTRMLSEPPLRERCQGVRLFISASAPLPPSTFDKFQERTGHNIIECWGMTETMTNTANPIRGEQRRGSVGLALPGVELRAVDGAGHILAAGEAGVLEVRSRTRFAGYWRREGEGQAVFRDNFFVTGDIGRFDAGGYLTIVGRSKDVVISGGYNVYPREVELALEQMDGISRAAVFGLPHPDYGEAVTAAIETDPGRALEPEDIIRRAKVVLSSYKVPKAVLFVDSLPRTDSGKVRKSDLVVKFKGIFCPSSE